jgi:hypothetical protein
MMPDPGGNPESKQIDPEQLSRLIELELAQKRAAWKKTAARRQKTRIASFFFLFLLIVASFFAFFVLFSRVNQERANQRPAPAPSIAGHR